MSETPLSEVFNTEADEQIVEQDPTVEATEEVTDETEVEAEAEAEANTEEAAPSAEKPVKDVSSEVDQLRSELNAFKTKAMDERSKRQEMQRQLEQEKPDAYVEPDKAIDYGIKGLKSEFENRFLNMSEFNARSRHGEDFDQMTEVFFEEMAAKNPALQQQAMQHPDPYEFIYQQAKTHAEFKDIGSIDDYKKNLEAKIRAEVQAEMQGKLKEQTEELINKSIPNTLSTSTAAGGSRNKGYSGPTPLGKILGN